MAFKVLSACRFTRGPNGPGSIPLAAWRLAPAFARDALGKQAGISCLEPYRLGEKRGEAFNARKDFEHSCQRPIRWVPSPSHRRFMPNRRQTAVETGQSSKSCRLNCADIHHSDIRNSEFRSTVHDTERNSRPVSFPCAGEFMSLTTRDSRRGTALPCNVAERPACCLNERSQARHCAWPSDPL